MKKLLSIIFVLLLCLAHASCTAEETEKSTENTADADHVHSFGEWKVTKEPTCTEEGEKEQHCACGAVHIKSVDSTGHKVDIWETETEPTCSEWGKAKGICTVCNEETARRIKPTGEHSLDEKGICKLCGEKAETAD